MSRLYIGNASISLYPLQQFPYIYIERPAWTLPSSASSTQPNQLRGLPFVEYHCIMEFRPPKAGRATHSSMCGLRPGQCVYRLERPPAAGKPVFFCNVNDADLKSIMKIGQQLEGLK